MKRIQFLKHLNKESKPTMVSGDDFLVTLDSYFSNFGHIDFRGVVFFDVVLDIMENVR